MTHCRIILLHHNQELVSSVLDQFEDSIIHQKKNTNKVSKIIQSKRTLAKLMAKHSLLNYDLSFVVMDFANPSLKVTECFYGNIHKSDILLSFHDRFVGFNQHEIIDFASKNFKNCQLLQSKTCFIQLFDEHEAKLLLNDESNNNLIKMYGFLTRLYCSTFERSHHIHLFAKNKKLKECIGDEVKEKALFKMKRMNIYNGYNGNNNINNVNQEVKNYQLASFTSIKMLYYLLSTIISNYKQPTITMLNNRSFITKIKLRLNVVQEIKNYARNQCINYNIADLVNHIMKSKSKYQSNSQLRTSYTS